jgi:hypothetical protein
VDDLDAHAMPVNCRRAVDYGTVSCQVPITLYGFPPEKCRPPESLHFAFAAVGALLSRVSVVTPVLALVPHALPSEWRYKSSLGLGAKCIAPGSLDS